MLLHEYLLLDLGRVDSTAVVAWLQDMEARRRAEASRDLLALWRPEENFGRVIAMPIMGLHRFGGDISPQEFTFGLTQAAGKALQDFGITPQGGGEQAQWQVDGRPICRILAGAREGVGTGSVLLEVNTAGDEELQSMARVLGRPLDLRAVGNAFAFRFEEVFGFAQAAMHPVAYEERLRPPSGRPGSE